MDVQLKEAKLNALEAIQILNNWYKSGNKHKDQTLAHMVLGDILLKSNDFHQAKQEYEKAEHIYKTAFVEMNYSEVSILYFKLANLAVSLKDQISAKKYLSMHRSLFGNDHPNTKKILNKMIQVDV